MNIGTSSLFSQLLSLVDRDDFRRLVRQTGSEARTKGFGSWDHFVSMLFCQLAQAKSLREIDTGLGIEEANTPEFPRVVPLAFVSAQSDGLVAAQTAGLVDRAGLAEVESRVAFRPDDKVGVGAFDSKQPGKVEVSPVKDIDTPGLNEHPVHEVDVMHRTVCDLYKDGDRTGQVDLGMEFYRGFGLAEMRPREHIDRHRSMVEASTA